jgi:hypothetical protein
MLLMLSANVASWAAIRQISHREAVHAAERCADPAGDLALRRQWSRVEQLYRDLQAGKIAPAGARVAFVDTYQQAIREAGAPPNCLGAGG